MSSIINIVFLFLIVLQQLQSIKCIPINFEEPDEVVENIPFMTEITQLFSPELLLDLFNFPSINNIFNNDDENNDYNTKILFGIDRKIGEWTRQWEKILSFFINKFINNMLFFKINGEEEFVHKNQKRFLTANKLKSTTNLPRNEVTDTTEESEIKFLTTNSTFKETTITESKEIITPSTTSSTSMTTSPPIVETSTFQTTEQTQSKTTEQNESTIKLVNYNAEVEKEIVAPSTTSSTSVTTSPPIVETSTFQTTEQTQSKTTEQNESTIKLVNYNAEVEKEIVAPSTTSSTSVTTSPPIVETSTFQATEQTQSTTTEQNESTIKLVNYNAEVEKEIVAPSTTSSTYVTTSPPIVETSTFQTTEQTQSKTTEQNESTTKLVNYNAEVESD